MACSRYLQEFGFITLWRFREPLFDFQRLEKYWRGNLSFGREVNFKFDKSSLNDSFGISCAKLGSKCFKSTYPQRRTSAEARSRRACRCPRRAINFVFRLNTRRWDLQRAEIHFQTASLSLGMARARPRTLLLASAPERDVSQRTRLQRRFIESLNYFAREVVDGETNGGRGVD